MARFFIMIITSCFALAASDWPTLLEEYRLVMGEEAYMLLARQERAYRIGTAPTVADPLIKTIPIHESGEGLVDVDGMGHPRIKVMEGEELIQAHSVPEDIDPRATVHGMVRQEVFNALVRMITELDSLAPVFGYAVGELEIRLFEGLRDLATQKELFDSCMERIQQQNPSWSEEQAYQETTKWVSPYKDNVPVHSTGGAVDIHLWSSRQNGYCPMGHFNKSGSAAPTFSSDIQLSDYECRNRLLMLVAATRAGLTNYTNEFWHYSVGDRYGVYWRIVEPAARSARYGSK